MMGYRDSFLAVMGVFVLSMIPAWFMDASSERRAAPVPRPAVRLLPAAPP